MTFTAFKEILAEYNSVALLADGCEDALIGVAEVFNRPHLAVYDRDKCLNILMDRDGRTEEEAEDFFTYNVTGSWVGEHTPIYVTLWERT